MSKPRIGINGFGRVGRALFRANERLRAFDVVAVNDLNPDPGNLAYLLQYDSTYGKLPDRVSSGPGRLTHRGRDIRVFCQPDIAAVPWADAGVEIVIEATGVADNVVAARRCGMPVVVTASPDGVDETFIWGVNESRYDPAKHRVIAASICDANACAPVLKVLDDKFGVEHGFCTTLHPWLSYQNIMDGPSKSQAFAGEIYHHYALGRDSTASLIPKPTTVVSAVERVLPHLAGKLDCFSYRVPTKIVASADLSLKLRRPTTAAELKAALREAAKDSRVLLYTEEPLVSVDFAQTEHSAAIDGRWVKVSGGDYAKIVLWYDNEWGYVHRVLDLLGLVAGVREGAAA